jgi:uncharacterized protein (TIGR02466 family)
MLHELWPTTVYHDTIDTAVVEWIKTLLPEDSLIRSWQGLRPWSTDDLLHEQTALADFTSMILDHANRLADHLGIVRDELYITSMWANVQYQRQNHAAHTHANSLFSGVYYLQVPLHSQALVFYDPRPQSQVFKPSGPDCSITGFHPRVGDLYLWPSWLLHSTQSTTVEELSEPRISISWNIQLHSDIQDHSARWRV